MKASIKEAGSSRRSGCEIRLDSTALSRGLSPTSGRKKTRLAKLCVARLACFDYVMSATNAGLHQIFLDSSSLFVDFDVLVPLRFQIRRRFLGTVFFPRLEFQLADDMKGVSKANLVVRLLGQLAEQEHYVDHGGPIARRECFHSHLKTRLTENTAALASR